jgi:hypothetical protein
MTTIQRFLGAMTALMVAASTNAQSAPSDAAHDNSPPSAQLGAASCPFWLAAHCKCSL